MSVHVVLGPDPGLDAVQEVHAARPQPLQRTIQCRCTEAEAVNAVQYRCTVTAHLVEAEQWLLGGGAPVTSAGAAAHWAPGRILVIFTR